MSMAQKRSRKEYEADLRKQEAPFVLYGTPLPLLDDSARDDGSYVPIWKQEVTDDRGRKRLHGAFTGGFSAGYFNTVGTKEGWTPSTFVSSRSNRAKDAKDAKQLKAEDFMDEEDLRELEETRQVSTAEEFAGFGTGDDANVQHALDDVFRASEDTMGEKLLNRMGWKKGQGIGPRTSRRIDPGDPNSEVRDFPPEDSLMLAFSRKDDTKGLGFGTNDGLLQPALKPTPEEFHDDTDNGDVRPGLSFMNRPTSKVKKPIRSGIGVGSLNDTGSDDEDPCEMGPKVSFNKVIGGDKKQKKSKTTTTSSNANPLLKTKPVFISKSKQLPSALSSLRKCHDGKVPLAGFILADSLDNLGSMTLSDDKDLPPEVPEDWQPARLTSSTIITDEHAQASTSTSTNNRPSATHPSQTADTRRRALGEEILPGKSIFDYLSPAARDRLASASGNTNLPPALSEAPPEPTSKASSNIINPTASGLAYPSLDAPTATAALLRLRKDKRDTLPYATDLQKQTRYKDFLRYSADPLPAAQRIPPIRAYVNGKAVADDEHLDELGEFAATAELFKPSVGYFADRFAPASNAAPKDLNENGTENEKGDEADPDTEELLTRRTGKPADPAEEAARIGMFGIATRHVRGWIPTRLVCKRFMVEMPIDFNE